MVELEHMRVARPEDGLVELVIDRPEKLNAITVRMRRQIGALFAAWAEDAGARVVVIRGAGERAFSVGGDVEEFLRLAPHELVAWGESLGAPERFPGAVIAAIDGFCLGAGLELALACDFRIATTRAEFGLPEVRLGMMPGSGGTQRVLRSLGITRTKAMVLSGRRIQAGDAERWGLISQAVEPEKLMPTVYGLARELRGCSPLSFRVLKETINRGLDASLDASIELERRAYTYLCGTEDYKEGVRAFLEKRPPRFTGR